MLFFVVVCACSHLRACFTFYGTQRFLTTRSPMYLFLFFLSSSSFVTLGAMFFSSIGMLINPAFLLDQAFVIGWLTVSVLVVKGLVGFLVVRAFGHTSFVSITTGLGLAQISEFAFVLTTQGLQSKLMAEDAYRTILGTTAVSLFITPLVFQATPFVTSLLLPDGSSSSDAAVLKHKHAV